MEPDTDWMPVLAEDRAEYAALVERYTKAHKEQQECLRRMIALRKKRDTTLVETELQRLLAATQ